jgi:iron complex outermembrane receptor protein
MTSHRFSTLPLRALWPALFLSSGIFSPIVWANHDDDLSVDYFFQDLPVVLSATRLSQPLPDIPAAMTVIDREMIQASGAMNIPDVLRLVPGMAVGFYSGSRATVAYHGLADEYSRSMQVLVDGRSIYDPGFGGVSWPDMPIEVDEIARIEVVRGPNAAAYGSNSYAGVINIITEHPADQLGTTFKTVVGGGDKRKVYARYADESGEFSYRISANHQELSGFDNIPDDEETHWVSFHGDYIPDAKNSFQAILGASEGTYQEGFNEIAQKVRKLENQYNYQQLNWDHQLTPSNEIKLQLYHNFFEIVDHFQSPVLSEVIKNDPIWEQLDPDSTIPVDLRPDVFAQYLSLSAGVYPPYPDYATFLSELNLTDSPLAFSQLGFKSHRYDMELQQTLSSLEDLRLAWGLGIRQDSVEGIWLFHSDERITRDQWRLFGNLEWYFQPDWIVNLGGMLERFEKKQPFFSPRLALNYHYDSSNTFRLSTSRAYRMPTLFEDFVNQVVFINGPLDDLNTHRVATKNLDPQRIDSYEFGYLGSFPSQGLTIDVRLFREKLSKIIDDIKDLDIPNPDRGLTDPDALAVLTLFNNLMQRGAFTYTNTAQASIRGLELNLHFKPTPADLVQVGYAYLDAEGSELRRIGGGDPTYASDDLGNTVPDHTFSLLASHRFGNGFQISSAYYFMDDLDWPGDGDEVPSLSRWDLRVAKNFHRAEWNGEIALLFQSLGEESTDFFEDEDSGRINIWKRRVFLQASLNFH